MPKIGAFGGPIEEKLGKKKISGYQAGKEKRKERTL